MNRFEENHSILPPGTGRIIGFILLALVLALFFFALRSFGRQTIVRQEDSLRNALERDIVQCYALEGNYPPSLSYIEEHYGLTYDHSTFFVDYRPVGDNLYPDVTILMNRGGIDEQ